MSNFLAVATVTATLSQIILDEIQNDVTDDIVTVTTVAPSNSEALPKTGVNLFLYQVTPNISLRNNDLPTRNSNGQLVQHSRVALDLNYLLTFYGDDNKLQPQRLMGSTVRTLEERPVLDRAKIRTTIGAAIFNFLSSSNLADEVEQVKLTPLNLSLDDLSKLWSVFFQSPYALSLAYRATVVLIEGESSPRSALPVLASNFRALAFGQPTIESVEPNTVSPGEILTIKGQNLQGGEAVTVSVSFKTGTQSPTKLGDRQMQVKIPADLEAGVNPVQVIHLLDLGLGAANEPHQGFESNAAAFILRPKIDTITITPGLVTIKLDGMKVSRRQRAALLLNEFQAAPTSTLARSFTFRAKERASDTPVDTLEFPIRGVSGQFLIRVQIDGAESGLTLSGGRFSEPKRTF